VKKFIMSMSNDSTRDMKESHVLFHILLIVLFLLICVTVLYVYYWKPSSSPTFPVQQFTFGKLVDDRIELRYLENFLTSEECDHLIEISKDKLARSQVIDRADNTVDKARTSHSYYIPSSVDGIVQGIEDRIAKMVNKHKGHLEGLQVVRYKPGDYFREHHDWFHPPYRNKVNNQRQYTFFVYLNDIQGAGGQTEFPKLKKEFYPKKGHALFWRNCTSLDECSDLSLHQGKAPISDMKYGLNIWVQFNPTGSQS
jgi:prolyl 4-hydroxylase